MATAECKRWAAALSGEQISVDSAIGEGVGLDVGFSKVLYRGIRLRAVMEDHFPLPASFINPPASMALFSQVGSSNDNRCAIHSASQMKSSLWRESR